MAVSFGNSFMLWINKTATFYPISGQQDMSKPQSAGTMDIGSKATAPYTLNAPNSITVSITGTLWPDLPDVNGFEHMHSLFTATAPTAEIFQIRRNGIGGDDPGDVEFECLMYVTQLDEALPRNGVRGYSFTLTTAAVPTVNTVLA